MERETKGGLSRRTEGRVGIVDKGKGRKRAGEGEAASGNRTEA